MPPDHPPRFLFHGRLPLIRRIRGTFPLGGRHKVNLTPWEKNKYG